MCFVEIRRRSPIRVLRKRWPQLKWTAHRAGFGCWVYEASNGWMGWWTAHITDDQGGGHSIFDTFYVYKNSTNEPPEAVSI